MTYTVLCPVCDRRLDRHSELEAVRCYTAYLSRLNRREGERAGPSPSWRRWEGRLVVE